MTPPSDPDEAGRRLLRALAAEPDAGDHRAAQALLPEFVEAEMAGDDVSARFPIVQSHLDTCATCGRLHADLLDLLLADAAGTISPARELPLIRLPAPMVLRLRVREVVASALNALGSGQQELEWAIQFVLGGLASGGGLARGSAVAERAGQRDQSSEAAPLAAAAYDAMTTLTAAGSASLLAEQSSGGTPALLERVALVAAERAHLSPKATESFVVAALIQFGDNYGELVDLAGRPALTD